MINGEPLKAIETLSFPPLLIDFYRRSPVEPIRNHSWSRPSSSCRRRRCRVAPSPGAGLAPPPAPPDALPLAPPLIFWKHLIVLHQLAISSSLRSAMRKAVLKESSSNTFSAASISSRSPAMHMPTKISSGTP
ncbi:unnamed protein product [Linum trigynum]|uniref:Uncharacterized protein n=1 Tax=Linum trigynum TaxID=586398 RepID=A0AAV2CVI9_9ROSI